MIANNSDNPRQLWNCINRTLHRNAPSFRSAPLWVVGRPFLNHWISDSIQTSKASVSLPAHHSTNSLCNCFPKHFKDKITQIHPSFLVSPFSCNINFQVVHHSCTVFKPAPLTEFSALIVPSPNKSCELDSIPIAIHLFIIYHSYLKYQKKSYPVVWTFT